VFIILAIFGEVAWVWVVVIIFREVLITLLRMFVIRKGGTVIAASWSGKLKTIFQMVSCIFFLIPHSVIPSNLSYAFGITQAVIFYIAVLFTVVSGVQYIFAVQKELRRVDMKRLASEILEICGASGGDGGNGDEKTDDQSQGKTIAFAESLTGGQLSDFIVKIPGASKHFQGSAVTYSNDAKVGILGVNEQTLKEKGAVSKEIALQMAAGAKVIYNADFAISTTGVAGPEKEDGKDVGTVFVGFISDEKAKYKQLNLSGNRQVIRKQTCIEALHFLLDQLKNINSENQIENE
jgi:PncC family amidohydrolase